MRRLPSASILAALLNGLPAMAGLIIAGSLYLFTDDLWPGAVAAWVAGFLLLVRLVLPVARWYQQHYSIDQDSLRVRSGFIVRRELDLPWSKVKVVDVDTPLAFRLWGLAVVSVRSGGEDADSQVTLTGVDTATLSSLRKLGASAATASFADAATSSDHVPGRLPDDSGVIYRATIGDLAVGSVTYGQFVILGGGAALAATEVLENLGLLSGFQGVFVAAPVASAAGLILLAAAAGISASVIRYHGLVVRRSTDGGVVVRYGLLARRERVVHPSGLVGYRLQRNFIEMVLDRVRLGLYTTDSSRAGVNVVLPSLPRTTATDLLRRLVPGGHTVTTGFDRTRWGAAAVLARGIAIVLCAGGTFLVTTVVLNAARWVGIGAAIVVVALVAFVMRISVARLRRTDRWIVRSIRSSVEREDAVLCDAVHIVASTRAGRSLPTLRRVHVFAGQPRVLSTLRAVVDYREEVAPT